MKVVPSEMNHADITSPLLLSSCKLWFSGSKFLHSPESDWLNLKVGDNFTFFNTPCNNPVRNKNDTCLNNVWTCMCTKTDFSDTSSNFLFK